jgi:hypothetical protein
MTSPIRFAGVNLHAPPTWQDITADLPPRSPWTLAKADGVGVVQFTVARYRSGPEPQIGAPELRVMLDEFVATNDLAPAVARADGVTAAGNDFARADCWGPVERVVVWYVSNGRDSAVVTYVTLEPSSPSVAAELEDAYSMVDRLEF